jgi:hypothetical protein
MSRKFKVTSGLFQRFVHVEMLIDEMENLFGILNVRTRTDPWLIKTIVYITIERIGMGRGYPSVEEVEAWWKLTDKSGALYKIEECHSSPKKCIGPCSK